MELIYGTGNSAKILYMKRMLKGLPIEITGLKEAAAARNLTLPEVAETGSTPLENAGLKAESYFKVFKCPVFSCDSGLYLWEHDTGKLLPEDVQPGIHVRGKGEQRLSDGELLEKYIGLVREFGSIRARYMNAICLIWNENIRAESMDEELWGTPFLLTDVPHKKRMEGFPLDSISLELKTRRYFYDMEGDCQDEVVSDDGFVRFFSNFLEKHQIFRQN